MLYVISFLAPYTRISSKQNADAISKGYQFMQQFTLSLKASLASEAQALEGKFGEVLCYLLQLSPSALLQCSHHRLPFAAGKGRFGTTQLLSTGTSTASMSPVQPEDPLTHFVWVKAVVWDWTCFNSQSQSSRGHYLQEKENKLEFIFPVPETVWSSCWGVIICCFASVPWPTPASPLVPYKHFWGQQGIIAPLFHRKATDISRKQLLVGWKPHLSGLLLGR